MRVISVLYLKNGNLIMKDYSTLSLPQLLVEKKKNLAKQAELREQSSLLDFAITKHPDVHAQVNRLSNTGGSTRVTLNGVIPKDLRVQYKITNTWDQEFLSKLKHDIPAELFPFKTIYKEDTALSKMLEENHQDVFDKCREGLVTKINERPYIQFIDPLKGDE